MKKAHPADRLGGLPLLPRPGQRQWLAAACVSVGRRNELRTARPPLSLPSRSRPLFSLPPPPLSHSRFQRVPARSSLAHRLRTRLREPPRVHAHPHDSPKGPRVSPRPVSASSPVAWLGLRPIRCTAGTPSCSSLFPHTPSRAHPMGDAGGEGDAREQDRFLPVSERGGRGVRESVKRGDGEKR